MFAVHLSDGIVTNAWAVGGFAGAALLALIGAWRIRDDEIPQVALLTAAFFVASLIHVPALVIPRVHLLLNGLVGVVLGRRAGLAIPLALALQAALFQHGGFSALGINSCVMGIPALLAAGVFACLRRTPWMRQRWFRAALVMIATSTLLLSLVFSVALLASNPIAHEIDTLETAAALRYTFHPATLVGICVLAALAAFAERRLENAPEFPVGFLIGAFAVLATSLFHALVLLWGGQQDWHTPALLTFVGHLPLACVEGIVLGFMVGFLARVKPEMIGLGQVETRDA